LKIYLKTILAVTTV